MTNELNYPRRIFVNTAMCKSCGQPPCDLCIKERLTFHVSNRDLELRPGDVWWMWTKNF